MKHTKIDWCEWTWNPAWGCKKIKADKEQASLRDKGASVDQIELKLW
jgi:protein gp37